MVEGDNKGLYIGAARVLRPYATRFGARSELKNRKSSNFLRKYLEKIAFGAMLFGIFYISLHEISKIVESMRNCSYRAVLLAGGVKSESGYRPFSPFQNIDLM